MSFAVKALDYNSPFTKKYDYSGGSLVIYAGEADPGSATSDAKWKIMKFTYDGNNNVTDIQFMNKSNAFDQIWDNRAAGIYS